MNEDRLDEMLDRSSDLHRSIAELTAESMPLADARFTVSFQSGALSLDYAIGAYLLLTQGLPGPAFSLHRPQYETLVRGIWLLHAASNPWVDKLSQRLTVESAKKANRSPMLSQMLEQLDKSDAPDPLVQQLVEFRDVTWPALNSFAHGGIHPIARTIEGYPLQLAYDSIRNSNGLMTIAAQLILIVSGQGQDLTPIRELVSQFSDCVPMA